MPRFAHFDLAGKRAFAEQQAALLERAETLVHRIERAVVLMCGAETA